MGGWYWKRLEYERFRSSIMRICIINIDTQEQITVHMCGFEGVWKGNYFGGEAIRRTEVEVRVGKLENGKAAGKDEVTRDDKRWK